MFVEEFIQFYTQKIIPKIEFHYEDFVDFYMDLMRRKELKENEKDFFSDFNKRYGFPFVHKDLIYSFHKTFAQLIGDMITIEWPESPDNFWPCL